jgi:hypothetical protein
VWQITLAVLLLSRGLAEVVLMPVQWSASQAESDGITITAATFLSALVGINLPRIVLFDPKDVLKETTELKA